MLQLTLGVLAGALLSAVLTGWLMYRHVSGVTRLLRMQRRRSAAREHLLAGVFDATSEGILIVNRDMRIVEANRAFLAMSGYGKEELLGQHPRIMQSGRQDADFYTAMWQGLLGTGQWQGKVWDRR